MFENFAFGIAQARRNRSSGSWHKIRVASVSKIAVAIAILMLVEEQHFSLDDDVSALLGWKLRNPNFPKTPITVRSLLSHTSSVRDGTRYFIEAGKGQIRDFFYPDAELWDQGAHWATEPIEEPGRYFSYANLNFGLLAAIIERASNQRFDLFLADRLFEPLALEADFNPCNLSRSQLATTYRKRNAAGHRKSRDCGTRRSLARRSLAFTGCSNALMGLSFLKTMSSAATRHYSRLREDCEPAPPIYLPS